MTLAWSQPMSQCVLYVHMGIIIVRAQHQKRQLLLLWETLKQTALQLHPVTTLSLVLLQSQSGSELSVQLTVHDCKDGSSANHA